MRRQRRISKHKIHLIIVSKCININQQSNRSRCKAKEENLTECHEIKLFMKTSYNIVIISYCTRVTILWAKSRCRLVGIWGGLKVELVLFDCTTVSMMSMYAFFTNHQLHAALEILVVFNSTFFVYFEREPPLSLCTSRMKANNNKNQIENETEYHIFTFVE